MAVTYLPGDLVEVPSLTDVWMYGPLKDGSHRPKEEDNICAEDFFEVKDRLYTGDRVIVITVDRKMLFVLMRLGSRIGLGWVFDDWRSCL